MKWDRKMGEKPQSSLEIPDKGQINGEIQRLEMKVWAL